MFDNLNDSFNDSSDTEFQVMSRQIVVLSSNIPIFGDNVSGLKEDGNFLADRP